MSAGSLAAGGTLGILLPPSFGMIVYGSFTETSVPKLFMAGVIPGVIMTVFFMIYIGVHAPLRPRSPPRSAARSPSQNSSARSLTSCRSRC